MAARLGLFVEDGILEREPGPLGELLGQLEVCVSVPALLSTIPFSKSRRTTFGATVPMPATYGAATRSAAGGTTRTAGWMTTLMTGAKSRCGS